MDHRRDVRVIAVVSLLSTTGVEDFPAGLQRLGLPAPMAFACSLAFRWVPAFLSTAHAVVQAQQARGLDLQGGNVVARAGRYVPLMIPMMTHVIRQTLLLAMAVEAKGFDPRATRASAGESRFTAPDYAVLAGLVVLLLLFLWLRASADGGGEGAV